MNLAVDLPEAEEELVAGYQTEYSGIKFGLFYIASYLNLLVSSLFVMVLYLGGWKKEIVYDTNSNHRSISNWAFSLAGRN